MAMTMVLRRMGHGNITVDGFRSSFGDWASERTNQSNEVIEMALAHTIANKEDAAYRRGELFDKRQGLMQSWAIYCTTPESGGKVIPLGRAVLQANYWPND